MAIGFVSELKSDKYTEEQIKGAIAMAVNDLAHEKALKMIPEALKLYGRAIAAEIGRRKPRFKRISGESGRSD